MLQELREEILPVTTKELACSYTRWWLPEDDTAVIIDNKQLLHQLALDPKFEAEASGRLFPSSPQYTFVNKRITNTFWERLGCEIRTPLTHSFFKVSEAQRLISDNITVMRAQRGQTKLPDDLTGPLDRSLEDGSFDNDAAHALVVTLAERAGVVPVDGPLDNTLRSIYVDVLDKIQKERVTIFEETAKEAAMAAKPERVLATGDNTRAWLARSQRKPDETFTAFFARAVVELAEQAPAYLRIFPETFADDIRDFLDFYNNINGNVDAEIATRFAKRLMPAGSPIFNAIKAGAALKDLTPVAKRCIQRSTRPTSPIRMLVMSNLCENLSHQIEKTLLGCGKPRQGFVARLCRVALLNFETYSYSY